VGGVTDPSSRLYRLFRSDAVALAAVTSCCLFLTRINSGGVMVCLTLCVVEKDLLHLPVVEVVKLSHGFLGTRYQVQYDVVGAVLQDELVR